MKNKRKNKKTSPLPHQISFPKRQGSYIPTEIERAIPHLSISERKRPSVRRRLSLAHADLDRVIPDAQKWQGTWVTMYEDMALREMEERSYFVQVKSKSWKKTREVWLSPDHLSLRVRYQSCGSSKHKLINLKKITEVRVGYQSPIWEKLGKHTPSVDLCFSLVLEDRADPINLIAMTATSAQLWIRGIQHLTTNLENLDVKGQHLLWVWEHFKIADKDGSGQLSIKEVKKLLDKLNFPATTTYVEKNLKLVSSGDATLSFEEFTEFFKKITWRPEIEKLYKTYCDADLKLQPKELIRFFETDQGITDVTIDMAIEMINKFEPDDDYRSATVMSMYGFTYLLTSPMGDIFNYKHRKVVMDMTQPLSSYYIASSHNTYLTDDQLFGKSSVECYIRALEKGCRCVELDCWDGDDGEPIIYHGYTLTSKISFQDVIEAVRDYAFKTSPYPVILSIENHCSIPQQNEMAEILKKTLGPMLLTEAAVPDETALPSPEQLKGKIIVKGKSLPKESTGDDDDGEVSDEDEAADIEEDGVKKHKKAKTKIKLSRDLSACVVYAVSRHFSGFEDAKARSDFHYISSLNEDKAEGLALTKPADFVKHTQWQLIRIYPKGSRTNSSNYNPQTCWNVGCQIVALNYQTEGIETYFNQARFRSNGVCGYVLKPPCLLTGDFNPLQVTKQSACAMPTIIEVRMISAQQLPKPPHNSKDVIDPYVVVSIIGCEADTQSHKTSVVDDNGFNPAWVEDKPMEFNLVLPGLAFLEFKVMDKDSKGTDDLVGLYMLAVDDIATGYRHIHLETEGTQILTPATLYVHISVRRDSTPL